MDSKVRTWLYDILTAIEEIESFITGKKEDFTEYQKDVKTRRAVERNLEIIGEALARIIKQNPNISIENARNIIGTRNKIIHNYDNISDELIWSIVVFHLPELKKEIQHLASRN